jgi:hypothetical protein
MRDIKPHVHRDWGIYGRKYGRLWTTAGKNQVCLSDFSSMEFQSTNSHLGEKDCKKFKIELGESKACDQMPTTPRRAATQKGNPVTKSACWVIPSTSSTENISAQP